MCVRVCVCVWVFLSMPGIQYEDCSWVKSAKDVVYSAEHHQTRQTYSDNANTLLMNVSEPRSICVFIMGSAGFGGMCALYWTAAHVALWEHLKADPTCPFN